MVWRSRKKLVVHIDGTLYHPNVKGFYSICRLIESVVEKLRNEMKKEHI